MFKKIRNISLGTLSTIFVTLPLQAAENINFVYGALKVSLTVDSLDVFAQENVVNKELAFYLNRAGVDEEGEQRLREILTKKVALDPMILYRFMRTPLGEDFLAEFGKLVTIPGGRNGKYAIRGAIIQSALSEEGLSLLTFLHNFPTDLELNVRKILKAAQLLQLLGRGTNELVAEMKTLNTEAAEKENYDFTKLPDLRQPGKYGVSPRQTWQLMDEKRQREYSVYLYVPERWREGKTPVIIISHGLASKPEDFEQRAKQLASYGYVVAIPQHPGSDFQYVEDMKQGFNRRVFELEEFINRPLDISYLLDELEKLNETQFKQRLDLNNVGVFGHSFGGYTAIALAGASINFPELEAECSREVWTPNVSLLLQCQALDLPRQEYNFRDPRITVVATLNAVSGSIFGEEGLNQVKIPIVFASGTSDPATPAAVEQLRPFVWASSQDKYYVLVEGQAHVDVSKLDASTQAVLKSLPDLDLPDQSIFDGYGNAFLVAFFENYLVKNPEFRPYFTSSYAQYLSEQPNPIYLVDQTADIPLSELFNRLKPADRNPILPPN